MYIAYNDNNTYGEEDLNLILDYLLSGIGLALIYLFCYSIYSQLIGRNNYEERKPKMETYL